MREGCGQRPGREGRPPAVTCEDLGRDRYKRIIARCTVAGEGLEKWMVVNGWALAYRRYSLDYVNDEAGAQAVWRGIWAGEFVPPWEWRRGARLDTGDYGAVPLRRGFCQSV